MWLICVDTLYYPYIEGFNTYEEALAKYNEMLEFRALDEDAIFLVKVEKQAVSPNYYNTKSVFKDK